MLVLVLVHVHEDEDANEDRDGEEDEDEDGDVNVGVDGCRCGGTESRIRIDWELFLFGFWSRSIKQYPKGRLVYFPQ